jgi:hypothetical protein
MIKEKGDVRGTSYHSPTNPCGPPVSAYNDHQAGYHDPVWR